MKYLFLLLIFFNALSFEYNDRSNAFLESSMKLRGKLEIRGLRKFYENKYLEYQLVDQVFEGRDFQIFVKTGLLFGSSQNKKFIEFNKGHLYHEMVGNIPVSIYFKDLDIKSSKKYKNQIIRFYQSKRFSLIDIIIPRAHANCDENYLVSKISNIKDIENVTNSVHESTLMNNVKACMSAVLDGVWQSTGGLVSDIGSGFLDFIKSPIKSSQKFWDSAVNVYENTKIFVSDFKNNIRELKDTLVQMPSEAQTTLLCNMISTLGTSVLVGIATGGPVGMARAMAQMGQKVMALKNLASGLKLISNLNIPSEHISKMISKIVKSDDEKSLKNLEDMASLNMQKLSMDIVQCAL